MTPPRTLLLLILSAALLPCLAGAQDDPVDLAILDVTVIDPATRTVLPHSTVLIEEGRIVGIEPWSESESIAATMRLAGRRKRYLIPGLIDMHVHLTLEETRGAMDLTLDLLIANGVTGVRDMAADCWEPRQGTAVCIDDLRRLAGRIRDGELLAPRLLALSSAIIRGEMEREVLPDGAEPFFAPGDAEDARQLAHFLAQRGVDLAKVYNSVPNAAYFALLDEAKALDLEVSGHLPLGVSVASASNAGHRTIEHARDLPVACSRYGSRYRETMKRVIDGDLSAEPPDAETRLRETLAGFDPNLCREVLETLAANGTFLVPTHGTREMDAQANRRSYRNDRRLRYIAPLLNEKWQEDLDRTAEVAPRLGDLYREFYDLGLRLTGMAHRAGVPVMVGTDANDTMIVPGFGLHDELERLSRAGLEPMDILRAATTVPAEYLGRSSDLGGLSEGRLADLVLLRADPLRDIANSREIEAVILGGRVLDRRTLERRLRRVERAVSALQRD